MRTEFANIQSAFDKLPDYTSAPANGLVVVNSNNTGFTTTQAVALGGSFTTSGAYNLTLTLGATVNLTLPTANDTLVGRATTDTLTNKTFDTGGTGNVFKVAGTQISAKTGTGSVVLATSPTLVTPALGVATCTSINGWTINNTGTLASSVGGTTIDIGNGIQLQQKTTASLNSGSANTVLDFSALATGLWAVHIINGTNIYNCLVGAKGNGFTIDVVNIPTNGAVFTASGAVLKAQPGSTATYNVYYSQLATGA